jgi:hypothetical protein
MKIFTDSQIKRGQSMQSQLLNGKFGIVFWAHFGLVILTWLGPFLAWWPLPVFGYTLILAQYIFIKKCVMNRHHQLSEVGGMTFYAHLFELAGFGFDRQTVRFVVRKLMMPSLIVFTLWLQLVYGFEPVWLTKNLFGR